jgi:hypothetical protein
MELWERIATNLPLDDLRALNAAGLMPEPLPVPQYWSREHYTLWRHQHDPMMIGEALLGELVRLRGNTERQCVAVDRALSRHPLGVAMAVAWRILLHDRADVGNVQPCFEQFFHRQWPDAVAPEEEEQFQQHHALNARYEDPITGSNESFALLLGLYANEICPYMDMLVDLRFRVPWQEAVGVALELVRGAAATQRYGLAARASGDNYKRGLLCLVRSVLTPRAHGHAIEFLERILPAVLEERLYDLAGTLLAEAPPQTLAPLALTLRRGTSRRDGRDHMLRVQQMLDSARPLAPIRETVEE